MPRDDDSDRDDATPRRRRPRDDDYEGDRPAPKRTGLPAWAIVLIALAAFGVLAVGGSVVAAMVFWGGARPVMKSNTGSATANRTYTREEFRTLLMGKTEAEVLQAVGKPDSTRDYPAIHTKMWVYKQRTVDSITGKIDLIASIHFAADGTVDEVSY